MWAWSRTWFVSICAALPSCRRLLQPHQSPIVSDTSRKYLSTLDVCHSFWETTCHCVGVVTHMFHTHLCTSAGLQPSPHTPSASNTLRHIRNVLGDFSESNTREYTDCEPLVLGVCLPLCRHGPTPNSCPSAHFSCQVAAKSSHPISLQYSQTDSIPNIWGFQ